MKRKTLQAILNDDGCELVRRIREKIKSREKHGKKNLSKKQRGKITIKHGCDTRRHLWHWKTKPFLRRVVRD